MLTDHAKTRMEQRAIPPLLVDLLYRYGSEQSQSGSTVLFFDKQARKRAKKALQDVVHRFDKLSDAYLVQAADSGAVITVGHRLQKIKRK